MLHSACVNVTPTARTLPLCAVVGKIESMSNRESKIAISKAALCYGFAIALRALFRVILCFFVGGDSLSVDCFASARNDTDYHFTLFFVIASEPIGRAWQATVCEARIMRILCLLIASAIASQ
ncbi:MAG: hypothetical protein K2N69_05390 [Helicobacter sp.]|nr:hypothetical protein [Helicobacter sp.]